MVSLPSCRFDRDTAIRAAGAGVYEARIDPGWFIVRGPNGGYVAAIALRALAAAVDDPARSPRSLTVHYLLPPKVGPLRIETRIERRGRSLTSVSGRLLQGGRCVALALAAFSTAREAPGFDDTHMPEVAPPEACPVLPSRIPIHERFEQRAAVGAPPFSGGQRALTGGWIRLAEGPRVADPVLVAAYADAWPPALFSRLADLPPGGVPTVDLTVHFRSPLPPPNAADDDYSLIVFRSHLSREGFVEEDGEIWSRGGVLLAQSRQLAVVM
jgi:acyl-CoA thioesterase